jgi:hypothetical protein
MTHQTVINDDKINKIKITHEFLLCYMKPKTMFILDSVL